LLGREAGVFPLLKKSKPTVRFYFGNRAGVKDRLIAECRPAAAVPTGASWMWLQIVVFAAAGKG